MDDSALAEVCASSSSVCNPHSSPVGGSVAGSSGGGGLLCRIGGRGNPCGEDALIGYFKQGSLPAWLVTSPHHHTAVAYSFILAFPLLRSTTRSNLASSPLVCL